MKYWGNAEHIQARNALKNIILRLAKKGCPGFLFRKISTIWNLRVWEKRSGEASLTPSSCQKSRENRV